MTKKLTNVRFRTILWCLPLFALLFHNSEVARAEGSKRGFITSSSCPLSCADAGVAKNQCKSWREGNKCMVEDFSRAPGHQSVLKFFSAKRQLQNKKRSFRGIDGTWITLTKAEANNRKSTPLFKHGMVTSSPCPFNCAMAGISKKYCREKKVGNTCQVEDLRQPPGHQSLISVTTARR